MKVRSRTVSGLATCLLFALVAATACGLPFARAGDDLARHGCRTDARTRAGEGRTAVLFVRSHVYVADDGLGSTLGVHFLELIPRLVRGVNDYLGANGAGIVLVEVGTDITVDRAMSTVDTGGEGGTPAGASRRDVDRVAAEAPGEVHLHWSPWSTSRVTGYAGMPGGADGTGRNWIGYIEDPISGPPRGDPDRVRLLAHELGHYLGLAHNGVAGNLMRGAEFPSGDGLMPAQVHAMQRAVNADRRHLLVVSCGRDARAAELLRAYPGAELLRLATRR